MTHKNLTILDIPYAEFSIDQVLVEQDLLIDLFFCKWFYSPYDTVIGFFGLGTQSFLDISLKVPSLPPRDNQRYSLTTPREQFIYRGILKDGKFLCGAVITRLFKDSDGIFWVIYPNVEFACYQVFGFDNELYNELYEDSPSGNKVTYFGHLPYKQDPILTWEPVIKWKANVTWKEGLPKQIVYWSDIQKTKRNCIDFLCSEGLVTEIHIQESGIKYFIPL